jgi:hypothetical protein
MKINTIILILVICLVLYYLYLKTEKFTQEESSNLNIEKPSGSYSDITGLYTLDNKNKKEKVIENYTPTSTPTESNTLAPVSSPIETIIDKIIANKYTFALSVTIPTNGIYPPDMQNPPVAKDVKLYLIVANKSTEYEKCTSLSGMLSLEPTLTKGGAFYLSSENRNIPKKKYPYKYLDFYNVMYDSNLKQEYIQTIFYGLRLANTRNYISYCAEGCDDNNGFCAQETLFNTKTTKYPGKDDDGNDKTDLYDIKNLLKFVIEGDTATSTKVTPYFVSIDPNERIHYLTNNYNTVYETDGYKKLKQVPIYEKDERPYYKQPVYVDTNTPSYITTFTPASKSHTDSPSNTDEIHHAPSLNTPSSTKLVYENIVIKKLDPILNDFDTDGYARQKIMGIQETQVTKNDAYIDFALRFNIEILTKEQIDALPV